jgi:hypothetical protein
LVFVLGTDGFLAVPSASLTIFSFATFSGPTEPPLLYESDHRRRNINLGASGSTTPDRTTRKFDDVTNFDTTRLTPKSKNKTNKPVLSFFWGKASSLREKGPEAPRAEKR